MYPAFRYYTLFTGAACLENPRRVRGTCKLFLRANHFFPPWRCDLVLPVRVARAYCTQVRIKRRYAGKETVKQGRGKGRKGFERRDDATPTKLIRRAQSLGAAEIDTVEPKRRLRVRHRGREGELPSSPMKVPNFQGNASRTLSPNPNIASYRNRLSPRLQFFSPQFMYCQVSLVQTEFQGPGTQFPSRCLSRTSTEDHGESCAHYASSVYVIPAPVTLSLSLSVSLFPR